jgi:hypothetical protein
MSWPQRGPDTNLKSSLAWYLRAGYILECLLPSSSIQIIFFFTYNSYSRVLRGKMMIAQAAETFFTFCKTQIFITVCETACQWFLS